MTHIGACNIQERGPRGRDTCTPIAYIVVYTHHGLDVGHCSWFVDTWPSFLLYAKNQSAVKLHSDEIKIKYIVLLIGTEIMSCHALKNECKRCKWVLPLSPSVVVSETSIKWNKQLHRNSILWQELFNETSALWIYSSAKQVNKEISFVKQVSETCLRQIISVKNLYETIFTWAIFGKTLF